MRGAGFGLVGLLVVLGIVMLLQRTYTIPMLQRGATARQQAQQLAGVDQSGMRASESIQFAPVHSGSKLKGVQVTTVIVNGPMNTQFGLLPGDVITGIVGHPDLDFIAGGDPDAFGAFVLEAYQRRQDLIVDRPSVGEIQLPRDRNQVAPTGQQPYNVFPTTPPPPPPTNTATTPPAPTGRRPTLLDKLNTPAQPEDPQ